MSRGSASAPGRRNAVTRPLAAPARPGMRRASGSGGTGLLSRGEHGAQKPRQPVRSGAVRPRTGTTGRAGRLPRGRHDQVGMRSVTTRFAAPRARPRRRARRATVAVLALVVIGAVAFGLLLALTPSVSDAEARTHELAAAHGVVDTGTAVPTTFAAALVATEDSRFYSHHGIDTLGALRAAGGLVGVPGGIGGATLDQQLAKMLYFGGLRNTTEKVQEVALALKLDASYSKPEILQMYAQTAYFGNQAYGIDAASCRYFGEPASALGWDRASLLAGLVQAPTAYDPYQHPDLARERQSHVLDRLVATGALTPAKADAARAAPWRLVDPARLPTARCES